MLTVRSILMHLYRLAAEFLAHNKIGGKQAESARNMQYVFLNVSHLSLFDLRWGEGRGACDS